MLAYQLLQAIWFYVIFSLFAGVALPLTKRLLPHAPATAYFLAKPLGLAIFGYAIWLLASLNVLSYQNHVVIGSLLILSTLIGFRVVRSSLSNIVYLELATLSLYLGYLTLRSYNAAADGTERFMDMALLNSSLKTEYFPFIDPWYAGLDVNYYYFGHYLFSLPTALSGISSFLTYNFALGLLYALSFMLAALLVYRISLSTSLSLLAGYLVTTAGSLYYSVCVIGAWMHNQPACNFATSTRLFTPSYLINEIPSYSFTVGDLHAHVIALPFFLLNLSWIYELLKISSPSWPITLALLIGVTTSTLINPSDGTTLCLLLTIVFVIRVYRTDQLKAWLTCALTMAVGLPLLYAPFLWHFTPPVLGFGFVPSYAMDHHLWFANAQVPTPFLALLGIWGVYVISIVAMIIYLRAQWANNHFLILITVTALFLILFVELFYVKDIFHLTNPPFFRANTVFKYGYHTWTLLSLAFALAMAALRYHSLPMSLLVILTLIYPYQAIKQYYLTSSPERTLDAAAFLRMRSADDLNTINWINQNIPSRTVVLEAVGDSYSSSARMSAFTGMITPMGWKIHEWVWRFKPTPNPPETGYGPIAKVAGDVASIYESPDVELTKRLMQQYDVQYLYIGNLERATYPKLDEHKLLKLGTLVYASGRSKLIKVGEGTVDGIGRP